MKINQNGRELSFRYTEGNIHQRTTVTLPPPDNGSWVEIEPTDFSVDVDPVHIHVQIGEKWIGTANGSVWMWRIIKIGELNES